VKAIEAIRRVPTPEQVNQALRDRQMAIAPIVKAMVEWMTFDRPRMLSNADGTIEFLEPDRTPEAQQGIDQCKAWIAEIDEAIMKQLHSP
jgi:hypothetical protein